MRFDVPLLAATFQERLNRFEVLLSLEGSLVHAHLANSGRLFELLLPGANVWLAPRVGSERKTRYDLVLVAFDGGFACVDARLPGALVAEGLETQRLNALSWYAEVRHEYVFGGSRLDLLLLGEGPPCLLEAKSITLVLDSVALFPDPPTLRGTRHLRALAAARDAGYRAAVVFVVQRGDAACFAPNDAADPVFGRALRQAAASGVEVYAFACYVSLEGITLAGALPVQL